MRRLRLSGGRLLFASSPGSIALQGLLRDQPTTGRTLDEENFQVGFVSIADVPHVETVDAAARVGAPMCRRRSE
jgi:hypothetical protein